MVKAEEPPARLVHSRKLLHGLPVRLVPAFFSALRARDLELGTPRWFPTPVLAIWSRSLCHLRSVDVVVVGC